MKHAVVAGLVILASVPSLSAQAPGQQPEGYPAVGAPGVVTLISNGAAPRSALRYAPRAGARQRMDTTMSMTMSMDVGGTAMPAMTIPGMNIGLDCVVTDVTASGDVSYTLIFTGAAAAAGASPSIAALMPQMNADLASIKGSATMSNRGIVRAGSFDLGRITGTPLGQVMGSAVDMLKNVSVALPEEEVGVGARWEVRHTVNASGMTMSQKGDYELVASDGRTVTLKVTIEQVALPQTLSNPALPPGAEVQLETLTGTGSGTMQLDLTGIVPTSDATMNNTAVMNVGMGGQTQRMAVTTTMKVAIAPGK